MIELSGDVSVIQAVAREWRDLCAIGPSAQPFFRPEWIAAYIRAFAPQARVILLTVRAAGRLCAVLPLIEERTRLWGLPVRKWRSPTNDHSCRFDLALAANEPAPQIISALWQYLAERGGWDYLQFQDVPTGALLEQLLAVASSQEYATGQWATLQSPFISLPEPGSERAPLLAQTGAKFQANLRRRRRKLETKGEVRLRRVDWADPATLQAFYELERAGWKGAEGTAIACDQATRKFYDEIAVEAERYGYLSLYLLECAGQPVAIHFGLTYGDRYFLPKLAYDETYRDCSPGQLIVQEILQECVEQNLTEFDFLGPAMEWKQDWTQLIRPHAYNYIFSKGVIGRLLYAGKFHLKPAWQEFQARWAQGRKTNGQP